MLKIGLTGGIGTGKSTVSAIFREHGIEIVDADIIAREVLEKYPEILNKVRVEFGEGFFDWRGDFRRKEFGNHIFKFPKQRIKYESIVMPYIKKEIHNEIERLEKEDNKLIIVDAPILIETGLHEEMDYVVLVSADTQTQIQRIKSRDGLANNDALNRINAQMSLEKKREFSNIIIDNNKDLENTRVQVEDIITFFKEML
ncbi:dephospho-CoA kinase [Clostridium thermobutyricum]|uniref:Dephospho-CoA kinase n=1 Tax=Clostridium thermobutyricum DSM 4928 TaxID=1121339 RepID=A0A1V4SY00_9CLOT|nr:dephospho-CoA kinase [Clostridium thermobutyricum]OPX49604.1 dephospho-CoA kinase [Clostridium thermobutyricum DSM 4928]